MLTRPDNDEDEIDDDQIEDSIADDEGKSLISNFGYVLNLPAFFFLWNEDATLNHPVLDNYWIFSYKNRSTLWMIALFCINGNIRMLSPPSSIFFYSVGVGSR